MKFLLRLIFWRSKTCWKNNSRTAWHLSCKLLSALISLVHNCSCLVSFRNWDDPGISSCVCLGGILCPGREKIRPKRDPCSQRVKHSTSQTDRQVDLLYASKYICPCWGLLLRRGDRNTKSPETKLQDLGNLFYFFTLFTIFLHWGGVHSCPPNNNVS